MKHLEDTISEMYFLKSNHGGDYNKLFSNKPISEGKFENSVIDKMLERQGLKIIHTIKNSPVNHASVKPGTKTIYIPPKSHFRDETAYYQILLHETSHYIGYKMEYPTSTAVKIAYNEYIAAHQKLPDYSGIIYSMINKGSYGQIHQTEKDLGINYMRDELKVEAVSIGTMKSLGYKFSDAHKSIYRATAEDAKKIGENAGINIISELIDKKSQLGQDVRALRQKVREELQLATKELGQNITKENYKNKDLNRDI